MPSSPELIARIAAWTSSKPDRQGADVPLDDPAAQLSRVLVRVGSRSCGPACAVSSSTGDGRLRSWLFRAGAVRSDWKGAGRNRRGAENGWNFHTVRRSKDMPSYAMAPAAERARSEGSATCDRLKERSPSAASGVRGLQRWRHVPNRTDHCPRCPPVMTNNDNWLGKPPNHQRRDCDADDH